MTDVAEEKRPCELLAGTPCSEFLLSEHFVISKEQKSIEGKTESLSPHAGVPAAGQSMNSGLPQSQAEKVLLPLPKQPGKKLHYFSSQFYYMPEIKPTASLISFVCRGVEMDLGIGRAQLCPGRLVTLRREHISTPTTSLLEFGLSFGAVCIKGCLSLCMWVLPGITEMWSWLWPLQLL